MRLFVLVVLAAFAGTAARAAGSPDEPVLAVEWKTGGGALQWLDARTLAPVGSSIPAGRPPASTPAVSPDGGRAAFGSAGRELRIVALHPLRPLGRVTIPGFVRGLAWPSAERILVVTVGETTQLSVIDARATTVGRSETLAGEALHVLTVGSRLVVLAAPRRETGAALLHVVDADGGLRTTALANVIAGIAAPATPGGIVRFASPGLTKDGSGKRVIVVDRTAVTTIDLDSLQNQTVPLIRRLPGQAAKLVTGWSRSVAWAGSGTVAVSGWEDDEQGGQHRRRPLGTQLVDLGTGRVRALDALGGAVVRTGSLVLSYGGLGLRAYAAGGNRTFELLDDTETGYLETSGHYAYVGGNNSHRFVVVDVAAGRVLRVANLRVQTVLLR